MLLTKVHHRFTIDDYDRMIDTGILTENDRVELIHGEILDKMPIGNPHIACVNRLTNHLCRLVGDKGQVSVQNPIRLDDSEPEPDVSILRPQDDFYASGIPRAHDVMLVVEVADSSLEFDRDVKGPMYAEAGIADFWIVNLAEARVAVYRQPRSDGSFGQVQFYTSGEQIDLIALPGITVAVADILA